MKRVQKNTICPKCFQASKSYYDKKIRRVRDLSCGDKREYIELEIHRIKCRNCKSVTQERLDFLADNPFYTKRFAWYVGRRCRSSTIFDNWKSRSYE
ncbi:MAG: transposase family protein [Melioribacteraceae bacterium]|nr:transposase family protein [Melioribacteraceae bacterium]MCF8354758.1 transposase family protein [Melioribacteraceae bacterium]MCF8394383.1 transposase family protein [Melioribacteraceae bacterium]MCF8417521.1 transposase family protein [Melioribacteraceae bacterium]